MAIAHLNSRTLAWTLWLIASIFYAYQYVLRVMPNILLDDIVNQFGISAATFGQFSGIYYVGYSLMHLPIGFLLDRFGPRKILSGCMGLTVIGLLPLLFPYHWSYPLVGRILIGIGSSAAILGIFKILRLCFTEKQFPKLLSFSLTIGLIGAIYGGGPVSYMRETLGYQSVITLFAIAGLALAVATYCIVPDVQTEKRAMLRDMREVLCNGRVILCSICAGLMVGPLEGFADVWGTAFLKQAYGFEGTLAASLPSMIFIGMCFGGPVLNLIAEKGVGYLQTVIGSALFMAASFFILLFHQLPPAMLSLNFVLIGICSAYQVLAIYQASTYVREEVAGLATAVANMIIMLFGYVFHTAIGGIVNTMGGPHTPEALLYGISVVPVALCLGAFGFILLRKSPILQT